MRRRRRRTFPGIPARRRIAHRSLTQAILAFAFALSPAMAGSAPTNVALHVVPREILFFSAPAGVWTSVRLDAGERVLQRGADGNVAAIVTSQRAIGFSAATGKWADVERFQLGR